MPRCSFNQIQYRNGHAVHTQTRVVGRGVCLCVCVCPLSLAHIQHFEYIFNDLIEIVTPSTMQILNEAEQPMQNGTVIGPLSEGQRLNSYCEARGGRPAPIVTWYSNGEKLHSKFIRIIITFHYTMCTMCMVWP